MTLSRSVTLKAGVSTFLPLTTTRPSVIHTSASRREQSPERAMTLARRSPVSGLAGAVSLIWLTFCHAGPEWAARKRQGGRIDRPPAIIVCGRAYCWPMSLLVSRTPESLLLELLRLGVAAARWARMALRTLSGHLASLIATISPPGVEQTSSASPTRAKYSSGGR